MVKTVSAKRHAQAVFELALEKGELDEWQADLEVISIALKDPQLVGVLENPKIRFSEKEEMLQNILSSVSPLALNLAKMLVAKNRLGIVDGLIEEFHSLMNKHFGKETAEVTTAIPLSDAGKEILTSQLVERLGKEMDVTTKVDPAIMGGVLARVGDVLIDVSIRTKLRKLHKVLLEAGLEVK